MRQADLCLVLVLLLGLLAARFLGDCASVSLVDDEACPALVFVPLEASEVGFVELIVRLCKVVSHGNMVEEGVCRKMETTKITKKRRGDLPSS